MLITARGQKDIGYKKSLTQGAVILELYRMALSPSPPRPVSVATFLQEESI